MIQYAIRKNYPHVEGSDVELSTEYIEKIVQLPIYIPELSSKDIENYLLLLVTQNYLSANDFQSLIEKIYAEKYIVKDTRITLSEMKLLISDLNLKYIPSEAKSMEDINIIDNIRYIVSSTLKGNPRQAKRFLNTFVTKKSLAHMYYGSEIDIRILAKLLVLQKLDANLFNQLNEWNKEFTVCNDKFKAMYEAVMIDSTDVEYTKWSIPTIKKWLECEPKDLYSQRLDKYFYLTRENLAKNIINPQNFSSQTRQVLEQLGSVKEGTISGVMEAIKVLSPIDIDNVFSVLLPRIENSQLEYFVIKDLFLNFAPYRDKILEAVEKTRQVVTLANTIYLTAMYNADNGKVLPVLERMKNDQLNAKLFEKIIGKKG